MGARFEVLIAVLLKTQFFWDISQCLWAGSSLRSRKQRHLPKDFNHRGHNLLP